MLTSMTEVKPRRREINAAATKSAMLSAALELFVSQGYAATSVDQIARASESSNGAVYHHFRDKRAIFTELLRVSQAAIVETSMAAMAVIPATASTWETVELGTRAFLRAYVENLQARALLRQAVSVLGWDEVRALDEEVSLPLIRGVLTDAIQRGKARSLPVDVTADVVFSLYCNCVLTIAESPHPDQTMNDVETVIFALLRGLVRRDVVD